MSKRCGCPSCLAFAIGKVCSWKARYTMRTRCAWKPRRGTGLLCALDTSVHCGAFVRRGNCGVTRQTRRIFRTSVHRGKLAALWEARCTPRPFFIERWSRSAPSFEKCTEVDGTHQKVRRCTEAPRCVGYGGVYRSLRGTSMPTGHYGLGWSIEADGSCRRPERGAGARGL